MAHLTKEQQEAVNLANAAQIAADEAAARAIKALEPTDEERQDVVIALTEATRDVGEDMFREDNWLFLNELLCTRDMNEEFAAEDAQDAQDAWTATVHDAACSICRTANVDTDDSGRCLDCARHGRTV